MTPLIWLTIADLWARKHRVRSSETYPLVRIHDEELLGFYVHGQGFTWVGPGRIA